MGSRQTLSEGERRLVAGWAADCAAHVLPLFEGETSDDRARDAIARTRAYAGGELTTAGEIRRRLEAGRAAHSATSPAGQAAARAAAQAAAVAHMGAHALGAAGYAAKAVGLAHPDDADAVDREIRWQLDRMSLPVRAALARLPELGTDASGPLGPGLLARGVVGDAIRALQAAIP